MKAAFLVAILAATPAVAADQFDLVCTPTKGGREVIRYRIDLTRGEWCQGPCSRVEKIASATEGQLVLIDHQPAFRGDDQRRLDINRLTGAWHEFDLSPKFDTSAFVRDGTCDAAPFSGFPAPKF